MTLNIQSVGHQPRFSAIAMRVDKTEGRGLPHVTAYVGDYTSRGYGDGDIVVVSPSGKVEPLVSNNRLVDTYTKTLRNEDGFTLDAQGPHGSRIHKLARPVFKELKAMFQQGELPMSGTAAGDALYKRLFEQDRPAGTNSVERLLTEALGFSFLSRNVSDPDWNNRHIFLDRTGRAFTPDPNRTTGPSTPTDTEGA